MNRRTYTQNSITVDYPAEIMFEKDNNFVQISTTQDDIDASITIKDSDGNTLDTLFYASQVKSMSFRLTTCLKAINRFNEELTFVVAATDSSLIRFRYEFTGILYHGKTLPYRSHGSTLTYRYSMREEVQSNPIQIYAQEDAHIVWADGTEWDIVKGINEIEKTEIESHGKSFTAHTDGVKVLIGNTWNQTVTYDYQVNFIEDSICTDSPTILILWMDTDGCLRETVAKVNSQTDKTSSEAYYNWNDTITKVPRRYVESISSEITIGIVNIKPTEYMHDIIQSEEVYMVGYNGERVDVFVSTKDITATEETDEIEIKLKQLV